MPAYVISDVRVIDPEAMAQYRSRAAASIAAFGGRYLVRGGAVQPLEGGWRPEAVVVVEFDSLEQARAWYASPAYAEALTVRDRALSRRLILVEGAAAPPR